VDSRELRGGNALLEARLDLHEQGQRPQGRVFCNGPRRRRGREQGSGQDQGGQVHRRIFRIARRQAPCRTIAERNRARCVFYRAGHIHSGSAAGSRRGRPSPVALVHHEGAEFRRFYMKRLLFAIPAGLALLVAACGDDNTTSSRVNTTPTATLAATATATATARPTATATATATPK
jgi:hypothetical protein